MNCEQVEDLLSAYLDHALAPQERIIVETHIRTCPACSNILADFRRFDALLANLPRISPDASLRDRIFSSPEYLELTGTTGVTGSSRSSDADRLIVYDDRQTLLQRRIQRDSTSRPHLVSLPGGRSASNSDATIPRLPQQQRANNNIHPRRRRWGQLLMQVMIAACLLLTLGVGSFIGWNLWQEQGKIAHTPGSITPPQGPRQGGPLPAGARFVFLHDGALESGAADGSGSIVRLTPASVTVAANWTVRPAFPGRSAGNLIAYIDLQQGRIHTIRSDGQSDSIIHQPLLQKSVQPSSIWDTSVGSTILNSLVWSPDGSMLAFVANSTGTPQLYIYFPSTGETQAVSLPDKGAVSRPVWSPDRVRIAFQFVHDGVINILDYNTQNHGVLTIASAINAQGSSEDTLLTLDWSSSVEAPAVTWSVGTQGHVHGVFVRRVGVSTASGVDAVRILATGHYIQATYSRAGSGNTGSWLLTQAIGAHAGDIFAVDLNSIRLQVTSGRQASSAQWSPDGKHVSYFDALSSQVGTFHVVDINTLSDTAIATGIITNPAPVWSEDGQHIIYNTQTHVFFIDMQATKIQLNVPDSASALAWSISSPSQAIVAIRGGVYLVDIQQNRATSLSTTDISGPILWTLIS